MAEMLNSVILEHVSESDLELIKMYCQENEMLVTVRPKYIVVWGTKRQLRKFGEYY